MLKKSKKPGRVTLAKAEIQNISNHGIWILVDEHEFFMSFVDFPWFLQATIGQIYKVEYLHEKHLHWPLLDVDVELESLKHLDLYPLKYA